MNALNYTLPIKSKSLIVYLYIFNIIVWYDTTELYNAIFFFYSVYVRTKFY